MTLPKTLVERLRTEHNIDVFFETGTYLGETALWAAERFHTVITIEKSEELHKAALADPRMQAYPNMFLVLADSGEYLKDGIDISGGPYMFWLDAHYSGGISVGRDAECPLLDELNGIMATGIKHFILIDDAHMFVDTVLPAMHNPAHWPHFRDIETVLTVYGYVVSIVDDVIVAVPPIAAEDVY